MTDFNNTDLLALDYDGKLAWSNERRKLSDLRPWPRNPRQIKREQAERLVESLEQFDQVETIAISPDNSVYNGHQRLNVWREKYGPDLEVDVRVASRPLTEKEREKLTVFLHKGAAGEWDFSELANWDLPDLLDWGFEQVDFAAFGIGIDENGDLLEDAGTQTDKADELLEKWHVERGDLFSLGQHRLLCGDSSGADDVARVMDGEKARLIPTSPPYADQREYELGEFDWLGLVCGVFGTIVDFCGNPGDIMINLGMSHKDGKVNRYWEPWLEFCESKGWPLYGWYIWDKGSGFPGEWSGRLAPTHEFVFHFSKGHVSANKWVETLYAPDEIAKEQEHHRKGLGQRTKSGGLKKFTSPEKIGQKYKIPDSVIRVGREMARGVHTQVHPAVFSVEFAEFLLKTWSNPGDVVLEPFSGSGTVIIAGERTGRAVRACELSPSYVAVTLERFYQTTGVLPVRLD